MPEGGYSLGGFNFGGNGDVSASTVRRRGRYVLSNILEPSDRLAFGAAEREARGAVDEVRAGYKTARQTVGGAFLGAKRAAIDQGRQAQGDALARLSSGGGLSSTGSIATNLRLGVGMHTARAIQDIQDRVAQIGAGLATQEGRDVGTARGNLSSFLMQRGLADRERNMLHWWLLTGQNGMASPFERSDISGLVKFAAQALGAGGLPA